MIDRLGFENAQMISTAIIAGLLMFGAVFLLELKRKRRNHLIIRTLALLIACTSTVLLALRPFYYGEKPTNTTVILTEGSSHIDSLELMYPNSKFISWSDSVRAYQLTNRVVIDGYGLPIYDLFHLEDKEVTMAPMNEPKGLVDIDLKNEISLGQKSDILIKTNDIVGYKLRLNSFNTHIDSVIIEQPEQIISFQVEPKAIGNFIYGLEVIDEQGVVISDEMLPLTVKKPDLLKILILSTYPTFEAKFMKNFLKESGHIVLVRSQITTNRYRFESYNGSRPEINELTVENLAEFDLVIADIDNLVNARKSEQKALEETIRNQGLGFLMLVNGNDFLKNIPNWAKFNYQETKIKDSKIVIDSAEAIIELQGYELLESLNIEPIFDRLIVTRRVGQGIVSASVISNSYQLVLSGKKVLYQKIWNKIIESIRRPGREVNLTLINKLTYVNEPSTVELTSTEEPLNIRYDNDIIPFRQNVLAPYRWSSTIWPVSAGWHSLAATENAQLKSLYVYDNTNWKTVRLANRLAENKKLVGKESHIEVKVLAKYPFSLWWFYLFFVVSMAYLWLEPKLNE